MKKGRKIWRFIITILMLGSLSFASSLETEIVKQKEDTSRFIKEVLSQQPYEALIADVFTADVFVEELPKLKTKASDELVLILPDVRALKKNIQMLSSKGMDIMIFLWDKPVTEVEHLKNRSYTEYKKLGMDEYKNVKVFKVPATKDYVYSAVTDCLTKPATVTNLFNKEIKERYINNSKYSYYKALENSK